MQAEYETGLARIDAKLSEMKAEGSKREYRMLGAMILVLGFGITILGFMD